MGGLQSKLIGRAKNIQGHYVLRIQKPLDESIVFDLKRRGLLFSKEYELELLLKYKSYMTPVVVHGVDPDSFFPREFLESTQLNLAKNFNGIILPMQLAYKVGVLEGDEVQLISPTHVDTFLTDIPRLISSEVLSTVNFDVPEIDGFHLWVKLAKIQNLTRQKTYNILRFYSDLSAGDKNFLKNFGELESWEKSNEALVYALNLESTVMIFLFGAMAFLVSFCISSGLLIFFNKVRLDLSSFWILGLSPQKLFKGTKIFLFLLVSISLLIGLLSGTIFLLIFKTYGTEILPDVFIDRKIPVFFTLRAYLVSFFLPLFVSTIFLRLSIKKFRDQTDHLQIVRSVGN